MANPTANTIKNTQSITLKKGEQFILPPGATMIGATNAAAIESTCEEIIQIDYTCGTFTFPIDRDSNDHHPLDEEHTYIMKVIVGKNEYSFQSGIRAYDATLDNLNGLLTAPESVFKLISFSRTENSNDTVTNKRYNIEMKFKVVSTLFSETRLHLISPNFNGGLLLPAVEVDC